MKTRFLLPTLCVLALALAACGGSKTESEPAPGPAAPPMIDTQAIEDRADEAAEEIGEAVEDAAEAIEQAIELDGPVPTGTSWQVGDYQLTFKSVDEVVDGTVYGKVQGRGGEIPAFMTEGMEFTYTLQPDGGIVIDTPRGEFRGTYDGDSLILDGNEGVLLEQ